uniref:Membrane-associated kinase regulator 6 n=1 Tax=Aegilops tauschii subsp. strangulata TaxID=200361 RepID=A0A453J5Q6_AEGTS
MEVSGSPQDLGDSFSYGWLNQAPLSVDRLAADAGQYSFGGSRSSFIDMEDPAELFSMRWTTPTARDFDFGLPVPADGGAASPAQLVSASQIFRGGRLLPCEPGGCSGTSVQEDGDGSVARRAMDAVRRLSPPSSPLFHSAQSTPLSLSACSSATSKHGGQRPMARRRRGSSPWKVLLRYVRFLMPLYRKARARHAHNRVAPAGSPSRGSTSSAVEWCHGNADTAVHDAILYCKKSSVSAPFSSNQSIHTC